MQQTCEKDRVLNLEEIGDGSRDDRHIGLYGQVAVEGEGRKRRRLRGKVLYVANREERHLNCLSAYSAIQHPAAHASFLTYSASEQSTVAPDDSKT